MRGWPSSLKAYWGSRGGADDAIVTMIFVVMVAISCSIDLVYNGKKKREEKHTMGLRSRCVSRPTYAVVTAIVATAAAVVERLVMMVSGGAVLIVLYM